MDIKRFSDRLKVSEQSSELKYYKLHQEDDKREFDFEKKLEAKFFVKTWKVMESVFLAWEPNILRYLNALGKEYWGSGNFRKCAQVDKDEVKCFVYNDLICPIPGDIDIIWFVEGPSDGVGSGIRFPIFGVRMVINTKPKPRTEDMLFTYYFQIIDRKGIHKHIDPNLSNACYNLAEALLESYKIGPYYREFGYVKI